MYECGSCGSADTTLVEYSGAYDGWLEISCKKCGVNSHRVSNTEIEEAKQPIKYGAIFFKCKGDKYYRNLAEITKEQYGQFTNKL